MILDTQTDLDPVHRTLHEKMRDLSIRRQNKTPLRQKVKWALHEKKHFERMIEDIIELVNALVETFPAVRQAQRDLYTVEVSEIGTNESLPVLENIAASQDQDLHAAISEVLKSNNGVTNTWNNYNSKIREQVGTKNVYGNQNIKI